MDYKTPELSEKGKRDFILVRRILEQNDEYAFADLYNYYNRSVYYMIFKMIKNSTEAEDLTIEAFEKAFQRLASYNPEYSFNTWLFKIAINNCIDHMRKKNKRGIVLPIEGVANSEFEPRQFESGNKDPEEELISKQRAAILHGVVQKIQPKYRRVIELKYLKEYSLKEMVTALQLPVGTIKAQLFRGRELLFQALNEHKEVF